jgi:hypothetical protein
MKRSVKVLLGAVLGAAVLGGCATDPYYRDYAYNESPTYYRSYSYSDPYYSAPYYYGRPYYYGPSVGLGFSYHRWR